MKKSDRAKFAELSKEVFGHKKAYIKLLKHGVTFIDKQGKVRVRRYSEDQLLATMIEALKLKEEAAIEQQRAAVENSQD